MTYDADGESHLHCGNCHSTDVTLTSQPPAIGTGPMGRPRQGDVGWISFALCESCGARGYLEKA